MVNIEEEKALNLTVRNLLGVSPMKDVRYRCDPLLGLDSLCSSFTKDRLIITQADIKP